MQTLESTTHGPAPDWSTFDRNVLCPLCDYSLRGLTEPRCPECGHRFTWQHVLSPEAQLHPYLFEHHPRRNAWSFWRTQLGGLLPRRFWRTLNPSQPSRPQRLVLYWLLASLPLVVMPLVAMVGDFRQLAAQNDRFRAGMRGRWATWPDDDPDKVRLLAKYGSTEKAIDAIAPPRPALDRRTLRTLWDSSGRARAIILPIITYMLWPWLTCVALMLFATSMQRANVKPAHVLRCAIYACDIGLLVILMAWLAIPNLQGSRWLPLSYSAITIYAGAAAIVIAAVTAYRLGAAYRFYMGFDRPWATALAAQAIVLLAVLVVLVVADDVGVL